MRRTGTFGPDRGREKQAARREERAGGLDAREEDAAPRGVAVARRSPFLGVAHAQEPVRPATFRREIEDPPQWPEQIDVTRVLSRPRLQE
jgi:hypothetical protein